MKEPCQSTLTAIDLQINRYKRLLLALKSKAVFVAGCDPAKTEGFSRQFSRVTWAFA